MKKLKTWQNLIICLVAEIIVFVLGTVFLHPFPISDENDWLMAFALYEFSSVMGIVVSSVYGLLDQKDTSKGDHLEIILVILIVGLVLPLWNIVLILVSVFTLILTILDLKRSSKSMQDPI